jgi:ribosomal protein L16 Arg81 hydroxylase
MKGATMATDTVDFARMIWPIESDAFFRDTWEKQPLVLSRKDPAHYASLFTAAEVDALFYFGRPRFSGVENLQQSSSPTVLRGLPQEGYAPGGTHDVGLLDLRKLYSEGKTVLVHSLQLRVPAVASLCRSLETALHHPVNVNMYLTPPGAQGFGPHYDDHDVFILQIEGQKHWRLYEPVRDLPLKFDETTVPRERLTGEVAEAHLAAGDLLYLPRGYVHEAFTSATASLHLTVGIEVFRWADLLISAIASLSREDIRFRRALPVRWVDATTSQGMQEQFRELLQLLADRAQFDEAMGHLGERFVGQLPALPDGRFVELLNPEDINLDTVLEKRPGTICHMVYEGDAVSIQFPGCRIGGPSKIAAALHFLTAATGPFTPRALPDDLSDNAKLILIRRLVREGLLTTVPSPSCL